MKGRVFHESGNVSCLWRISRHNDRAIQAVISPTTVVFNTALLRVP